MNTARKTDDALDIQRALAIDGWMTEPELVWLAEQASCHDLIVELGSFLGRSTRALGDHARGQVLAVDDWIGPREIILTDVVRSGLWGQFNSNLADLIKSGKVTPMKVSHRDQDALARAIAHNNRSVRLKPDMVFIDGDHGYEAAKDDILFWKDRIVPGGILCGHDVSDVYVSAAVKDCLPSPGVVPNTYIWVQYVD
jgi:hypothetical protein